MSSRTITQRDLVFGTIIAIVMAIIFTLVGGLPLVVTFVPGVALSWIIFLYMYLKRTEFPEGGTFFPFYFAARRAQRSFSGYRGIYEETNCKYG